jgi:hypothetical protein
MACNAFFIDFKKFSVSNLKPFMVKGKIIDDNVAAELITKEMWKKLRKTHTLRVVK